MKTCPNCNNNISENEEFCSFCGQKVKKENHDDGYLLCENCGSVVEPNENFCKYCGYEVIREDNTLVSTINYNVITAEIVNQYFAQGIEFNYEGELKAYRSSNPIAVLPPFIKTINPLAFRLNRAQLKEVHVNEGVEVIKKNTFYGCSNLSLVSLPSTVKFVEDGAFEEANVLKLRLTKYDKDIFDSVVKNCLCKETRHICLYYYQELIKEFIYEEDGYFYIGLEGVDTIAKPLYDKVMKTTDFAVRKREVDKCKAEVYALFHQAEIEEQKFNRLYEANGSTLTKYKGTDDFIIVHKRITRIGNAAFKNQKKIKYISFDSVIEEIEDNAFWSCTGLEDVALRLGLKEIGKEAFHNCKKLNSIYLPASLESIGDGAFENCDKMTEVTLPRGLKNLGDGAFSGCKKLAKFTFPPTFEEIPSNILSETALSSIVIPDTVHTIKYNAFASTKLEKVIIPESVRDIEGYAFSNNLSLKEIELPKDLKVLPEGIFKNCQAMEKINLPGCLTTIGKMAFEGCNSLRSIVIPNSVTTIEKEAFYGCRNLQSVKLPNNITVIPELCFANCYELNNLVIPPSVEVIEDKAFLNSDKIKAIYVSKDKKYNNLPKGLFVVKKYKPADYDNLMEKVYK